MERPPAPSVPSEPTPSLHHALDAGLAVGLPASFIERTVHIFGARAGIWCAQLAGQYAAAELAAILDTQGLSGLEALLPTLSTPEPIEENAFDDHDPCTEPNDADTAAAAGPER